LGAAIGGLPGALTGFSIGGFADLTGNIFAAETLERESLAKGLNNIAKKNFGGLSKEKSRQLATILQNQAYDPSSRGLNYDLETIQEDVSSFSEAGGFSNVTSGTEMEETLRQVVEQTRHFANTLKLKKDEATQIMADLASSMSMDGDGDFIDMASKLSHASSVTGVHPGSLASFGMQASEMFKGTGIKASDSFDMAIDARIQAEKLRQQDPVTRQLVEDAGGAAQFALKQLDQTNTYMSSSQGLLLTAGLYGGMDSYDSVNGMAIHAAQFLGEDSQNYFKMISNQGKLMSEMGLKDKQNLMVSTAVNFLKDTNQTNEDGTIDQSVLEGIMPMLMGDVITSPQEAKSLIEASLNNQKEISGFSTFSEKFKERQDIIKANQTTLIGDLKTSFYENVWNPIDQTFQPVQDTVGDFYLGVTEGIENFFEDTADFFNKTERVRLDDVIVSDAVSDEVEKLIKEGPMAILSRYEEIKKDSEVLEGGDLAEQGKEELTDLTPEAQSMYKQFIDAYEKSNTRTKINGLAEPGREELAEDKEELTE